MNPRSVAVSAPGKLMIMGEHAVVYNRPCLVAAVEQRMHARVTMLDEPVFELEAKEVGISGHRKSIRRVGIGRVLKGSEFVEVAVKNFAEKYRLKTGVKIETKAEFSNQVGFGSSSAVAVCAVRGLSELFNIRLSKKEVFDLCYKTVLDIQGKGSGFDIAAAIYGGVLYYVTGGKVIRRLKLSGRLPLVVGYTGYKASTSELIKLVAEKVDRHPEVIENLYDEIERLVENAKRALVERDWKFLGELMDIAQGCLEALGVGSKKLADMIYAAREVGAYGAKLSGAGVGDCMVALVHSSRKNYVERAIEKVGGKIVNVRLGSEGMRVEEIGTYA